MVQIWSVGGCGLAWFNPGPDLFYGQVGTGCFDGRVTAHEVCRDFSCMPPVASRFCVNTANMLICTSSQHSKQHCLQGNGVTGSHANADNLCAGSVL